MKLGISSYTFTWSVGVPGQPPQRPLNVMDLLDRAAMLEVGVLQVADNLPLDALSPAELDAFAARALELGIDIEVGTRGIQPEHMRRYLQLARRMRSPIIRVVIDSPNHHPGTREVVELLAPLRAEFIEAGVTLAIENHDRFTSPTLLAMVEKLGTDWVGVCLDTANSFAALEGTPQTVELLGPYCVNLHLKDFTIFRANQMMGFIIEGRPVGQGRLDVGWLLGKLRSFGRDPNAILELWTPPEATLEESIAKEHKWAELSIAFLQEAIKH
jgi:3-oxoisoapionate decarboxylase